MTRDQILEAAAQIIAQKGFHAASMQDIAEAVDLKKASLYHHVSSKQEILVDLVDRALDILIERISEVVEQPLLPEEKFRLAMRAYLEALTDYRELSAVLLLEHRSLESKMHKRHVPHRDRLEGLWRSIIEEGIQAGLFDETDPRLAIKIVLGVANWTIMWYQSDGPLSSEQIAKISADLLLNGLNKR